MTTVLPALAAPTPVRLAASYRRLRASAPEARRDLLAWLRTQPGIGPVGVDVAMLVGAELVANALVHGAGWEIHLRALLVVGGLRIAVQDSSREMPALINAGPGPHDQGNGLVVVSSLCQRWGVELAAPSGKWVWAALPRPVLGDSGRGVAA